jgi:hypothetical protein
MSDNALTDRMLQEQSPGHRNGTCTTSSCRGHTEVVEFTLWHHRRKKMRALQDQRKAPATMRYFRPSTAKLNIKKTMKLCATMHCDDALAMYRFLLGGRD